MTHRLIYYDGRRPQAHNANLVVDTLNNGMGIGTTSPSANLHVVGNCHIFQDYTITSSSTTNLNPQLRIGNSTYAEGNVYVGYSGRGNTGIVNAATYWAGTGGLYGTAGYFGIAVNGQSISVSDPYGITEGEVVSQTHFAIRDSGNVGISNIFPAFKLTIRPSTDFDGISVASEDNDNLGMQLLRGNGDGASPSQINGVLQSWWGIGFRSKLDDTIRHTFDCRTGNVYHSGNVVIGTTTSTSRKLHIEGDSDHLRLSYTGYPTTYYWDINRNIDAGKLYFTSETGTRMVLTTDGNLGIGTTTPSQKLDVNGRAYFAQSVSYNPAIQIGDNTTYSDDNLYGIRWGGSSLMGMGLHSSTYGVFGAQGLAIHTPNAEEFSIKSTGWNTRFAINDAHAYFSSNVGIGLTPTYARLDVGTGTSTHYISDGNEVGVYSYETSSINEAYFGYSAPITWATYQNTQWGMDGTNTGLFSIHAVDNIVTQGAFVSTNGALTSSDIRIKKDIVDVSDTEALDMVRNLEPKKYRYIDPVMDAKSNANVIGFIAQDVANVIPGSTRTKVEAIPNIMAMAHVTDSNVITFSGVDEPFDTSSLLTTTNILVFKSIDNQNVPANIVEVLGPHSVQVDRDLTPFMGSIDENRKPIKDEEGNNVGNGIFVYGQMVNDFHVLKKEVVFATGIAALQEVDRQQQADKAEIATLKKQVADLLAKVQALENA